MVFCRPISGSDCVMLSGETSVGKYPDECIKMMGQIATAIIPKYYRKDSPLDSTTLLENRDNPDLDPKLRSDRAIAFSAASVASNVHAKAIVCVTKTGQTARLMSNCRPDSPIIAVTPSLDVCRQLQLIRGVIPCHVDPPVDDMKSLAEVVNDTCLASELARPGDTVVITGAHPLVFANEIGTNFIKVVTLTHEGDEMLW